MKKILSLLITVAFIFMQATTLSAATRSFAMTASVPSATGVSLTVASAELGVTPYAEMPSTATLLNFGPMTFDTTNNIWKPTYGFMIEAQSSNGSGNLDATITYSEGQNPNIISGKGLGWHSIAKFCVFVNRGNQSVILDLNAHGPKKMLKDVNSEHIAASELGSGHLLVYLGLASGDSSEPTGAMPFSNSDAPGTYDGTLTVTASVL